MGFRDVSDMVAFRAAHSPWRRFTQQSSSWQRPLVRGVACVSGLESESFRNRGPQCSP